MDVDNYLCTSQRMRIYSFKKKIFPSNGRHHRILFNFICEALIHRWLLEDSTSPAVFLGLEDQGTMQAFTVANVPDPDIRGELEDVLEPIRGELENILEPIRYLSEPLRRRLIDIARMEARKVLSANTTSYVSFKIEFRLCVHHTHVYGDIDGYGGGVRMVPAVDSSIRLLKEYSIAADRCSICLEDFPGSGQEDDFSDSAREGLLGMPCDHVFHGGCIKKWLRTSHYCPLCRYKMPIN